MGQTVSEGIRTDETHVWKVQFVPENPNKYIEPGPARRNGACMQITPTNQDDYYRTMNGHRHEDTRATQLTDTARLVSLYKTQNDACSYYFIFDTDPGPWSPHKLFTDQASAAAGSLGRPLPPRQCGGVDYGCKHGCTGAHLGGDGP